MENSCIFMIFAVDLVEDELEEDIEEKLLEALQRLFAVGV
jgi:hypothetical protein